MGRAVPAVLFAAALLALSGCGFFDAAERWEEVPTAWTVQQVDGTTLTLDVEVGSSSCDRNPRIAQVTENENSVLIRAVRETLVNAEACTADLGFATMVVELDEPLGTRALEGCWPDGRDLPCLPPG